jgi:hypothetical protein
MSQFDSTLLDMYSPQKKVCELLLGMSCGGMESESL